MENLKWERHRDSTRNTYYSVWKNFNQFYIRLDEKPQTWEDRIVLFAGYLISNNKKSSTVKSYVSAIKAVLSNLGTEVQEDRMLLGSITRACRINYDTVDNKLPIRKNVVGLLIAAVDKYYDSPQPYLSVLYKAMLATNYFGLFRIGEITNSPHAVKAKDVYSGTNKDKMLFVLHSSKTHRKDSRPQTIKISAEKIEKTLENCEVQETALSFCPFDLLSQYTVTRKQYRRKDEPFFVFYDRTPVSAYNYRCMLSNLMIKCNLNPDAYTSQGMRAGRASDLLDMGVSVETIRKIGRWKSTSVYTYLRV